MIDQQTFQDIFGKEFDFEILMQCWDRLPKPSAEQYCRCKTIQISILRAMNVTDINDFISDLSAIAEIETVEFEIIHGGGNTFYWKPTGKIFIVK